jgi:hypothetical protein
MVQYIFRGAHPPYGYRKLRRAFESGGPTFALHELQQPQFLSPLIGYSICHLRSLSDQIGKVMIWAQTIFPLPYLHNRTAALGTETHFHFLKLPLPLSRDLFHGDIITVKVMRKSRGQQK